ncbi:hypothetical protein [Micromonospora sp. 067-2]|uniref:hypothetical protein n=1 Tax=Micromonospora sp. 067-2 TaxID=2789270 RepID=UPI00397DE873
MDLTSGTHLSGRSPDEVAKLPAFLVGSPAAIAERLPRYHEQFGVTYISVLEQDMHTFAKVMPLLR